MELVKEVGIKIWKFWVRSYVCYLPSNETKIFRRTYGLIRGKGAGALDGIAKFIVFTKIEISRVI